MGDSAGVKHVLLAKFKEEVPPEKIQELIKAYSNLTTLIPSMKSFRWGKDVSGKSKQDGFTHVFESTFDSPNSIVEYHDHPAHIEFAHAILPTLDKYIIVDYEPAPVVD